MGLNRRLIGAGAAGGGFVNGENFKAVIYTGNGGNKEVTGVGFQPDMIWIKERDGVDAPRLLDVTRGVNSRLFPSETNGASVISGTLNSFDEDGFTVGSAAEVNQNNKLYVAWCWKAGGAATDIASSSTGVSSASSSVNSAAGFSIIKYATNASSVVLPHGLGVTPKLAIVKRTDSNSDWFYYSTSVANKGRGFLNQVTNFDNSGVPTFNDTNITFQSNDPFSSGSQGMVYTFADIEGYSKVGTYTGTGNPLFVETGFKPAFILIRSTVGQDNWRLYDTARGISAGFIRVNKDEAENTSNQPNLTILSNGFEITAGGVSVGNSADGNAYIYLAFAADPDTEVPTLASSFNIEAYTGNGGTQSITGLGFSPSLVWAKKRSGSDDQVWFDVVRGVQKELVSNSTAAEATKTSAISSFDSDGFTIGNNGALNGGGSTYVGWSWKANDDEPAINTEGTLTSITSVNANAGFSIVQFTNTSASGSTRIGHGLSTTPNMIIVKRTDGSENWYVYHSSMGTSKFMRLDLTDPQGNATNLFNTVNSTVFNPSFTGTTGQKIIAYCFHNVSGYQDFGAFNGNSGSQIISLGSTFVPDFIMIKCKSTSGRSWEVHDTRRGINKLVNANTNDAEETDASRVTAVANGSFTVGNHNSVNQSGESYIYWAIAKNVPSNTTLANSFKAVIWNGNNNANRTISGVGFNADLLWIKSRNASEQHYIYDKVRGPFNYLHPNLAAAQATDTSTRLKEFNDDGFKVGNELSVNGNNEKFVGWAWKAGNNWESNVDGTNPSLVNANTANKFSIVQGTASGGLNTVNSFGHGLGVKPEVIILKSSTSTDNWYVYHTAVGAGKRLDLNDNAKPSTSAEIWANTEPTTSVFSIKDGQTLSVGATFIAYCWTSVTGYSKISSYSGTGDTQTITTGFQPDFILTKDVTIATDDWRMYDSVRENTQPFDEVIYPNLSASEDDNTTFVTGVTSTGFNLGTGNGSNRSGSTYIYMAFKMN